MLESIITIFYGFIVLLFGTLLAASFAGVRQGKRDLFLLLSTCVFSAILQLLSMELFSEAVVWMLYPLVTHLPLILVFRFFFHKHIITSLAVTFTAYLCCQPSKWLGVLAFSLSNSFIIEYAARVIGLIVVAYVCVFHLANRFSQIYNSPTREVCIFSIVPTAYYVFDYITNVYTDLWQQHHPVVTEFLPLLLVVTYMIFCCVYFEEYAKKTDAIRKEQIIRTAIDQQKKQIEAAKNAEYEMRLLRHDLRFFLSSLATAVEHGNKEDAQQMIASYITRIEAPNLERFCENDIINYVLSDFADKCQAKDIPFHHVVELSNVTHDVTYISSILSNALDNAINAQASLPAETRYVKLLIKHSDGKLLISVKNPFAKMPLIISGLPVADQVGHGYGTQSIRYLAERMGGNCQFSIQDNVFIVRVVL